jgi:hypothetical protein
LALIALVLLALGAAAAGYFSLRSYMPIHLAGSGGPGPGSLETRVVQNLSARTKYVVSGESSGRFGIVFDIKNTGRLPVKIEGLGGDAGSDSLVPRLQLHRARELTENRYYDFQPFTLESGETAFLGLEVIATNPCEAYVPGSSITWNSVSLRYSYARVFERETTIRLPAMMSLRC